MSWDVFVFNLQGPGGGPENRKLCPMGEAKDVRDKLSQCFPDLDWSDPTWGLMDMGGFSIEFAMPQEGEVESLALHVRGTGDPISAIARLCKEYGWTAFDTTTGEYLDTDRPSLEGWNRFQRYRNKHSGRMDPNPSSQ